jgi:SAM-dependent methyltransferase
VDANAYRQFLELERTHWWFRGRRSVYFGLLEHCLKERRPLRVLDLGCGMGGFLDGLVKLGAEGVQVHPSDVDLESLSKCSERGHPTGVVSSGTSLPYRDASFDLVCMFDAIEHCPDDHAVMREVARVLKPGGSIFVSVPAYQFLYANNDRVAQHYRRYTRGMLTRVFEGAGLEVERNTHANIFLFPLILPAVLLIKTLEKVLDKQADSEHTNLSWPIPGFVHDVLHGIFAAELPFSKRFNWPVGHSIAALARRPGGA